MNARAWNRFVLAGLLGTFLVLPATSQAAPPATLTAYMNASDVSTPVPPPPAMGQVDQRQTVYISVQVYVDSKGNINFLGNGTAVTPTTCGSATDARRVVTRKLGPPFPQSSFGTIVFIAGMNTDEAKALANAAYGRNYVITSVATACDPSLVKVTLQLR